ncbi:transcriptional regulator family protein [[Clostridium] sordellii ATCC 9714]|nr:transcriptional regulator family protein [[Clostridium] sordellii ATCC 9714] [Paeniclostridium sordellii ATCC 9714]
MVMNKIRNDVTYTIKALMYLYENQQFKNIRAGEIAEKEDIPIDFLYTILRKLKNIII